MDRVTVLLWAFFLGLVGLSVWESVWPAVVCLSCGMALCWSGWDFWEEPR